MNNGIESRNQKQMSKSVSIEYFELDTIKTILAFDALYDDDNIYLAAVLYDLATNNVIKSFFYFEECNIPYIPGLFGLREASAILNFIKMSQIKFDIIFCDGHGLAHPDRFGLACRVGVESGIPTIGIAKNRLIGSYIEPDSIKGSYSFLYDNNEIIGSVVRTSDNIKPVFVSVGNKISLDLSINIVLNSCIGFRIPEPLRQADIHVRQYKKIHCHES